MCCNFDRLSPNDRAHPDWWRQSKLLCSVYSFPQHDPILDHYHCALCAVLPAEGIHCIAEVRLQTSASRQMMSSWSQQLSVHMAALSSANKGMFSSPDPDVFLSLSFTQAIAGALRRIETLGTGHNCVCGAYCLSPLTRRPMSRPYGV
jgi:hypothetical protein